MRRLRRERDEAERRAAELLHECGRREVSDWHLAQMAKFGLETKGVIYMQCTLNALDTALKVAEAARRHAEADTELRFALELLDQYHLTRREGP